jgi:oligosaccharyltransferase complex subunit alpha (ribophorin I)
VRATIQQVISIINQCLSKHERLEASLHDLSRTGDVQACKTARKTADSLFKEYSKELKPLLSFLQSSPQATQILPKVCLFICYPFIINRGYSFGIYPKKRSRAIAN